MSTRKEDDNASSSDAASVASSDASPLPWEDRVRAKLEDAMFTATAVNEYGEMLIAFLDKNAHHPLDMQYFHSHLGDEPRSMRDRDDTPLLALISRSHGLACTPDSLQQGFAQHVRENADWTQFNELEFIRSMMAFVAKRMFKYEDESPKQGKRKKKQSVVTAPSTPAIRASLDYSRFANIDGEESEEE